MNHPPMPIAITGSKPLIEFSAFFILILRAGGTISPFYKKYADDDPNIFELKYKGVEYAIIQNPYEPKKWNFQTGQDNWQDISLFPF